MQAIRYRRRVSRCELPLGGFFAVRCAAMKHWRFSGLVVLFLMLAACPPPKGGGGPGGGDRGNSAINPDACGTIKTTNVGRKLYSFLVASAELDRASFELEGTVRDACKRMAIDLRTSPIGTTQEVCSRVATELQANLQVSVKSEKRLVTRHTPPVCRTNIDMTAGFTADCEASAAAAVNVRCSGRCNGTCNGTCSSGGTGGQCAGTCDGRCNGTCDGFADVNASAECKAAAEIHATAHTECTQPKVEVVQQDVTVVDASKFASAVAAIDHGLPQILSAQRRLQLASKALGEWVSTGASLVASAGDLAGQIGDKGACVVGQLAGVVAASADVQARFSVSVEVTAQVSASAGATAQ